MNSALNPFRFRERTAVLFLALLFVTYFAALGSTGVIGPDEPRYAAIGREMARSGDWVAPVLWGQPWFEKPPLLYWMTAAATRAGLGPDLAPRVPVALVSCGFLAFFWWILREPFGAVASLYATAILGTSAAWLAYSYVAVTDVPLSATFGAAMLIVLFRRGAGWAMAAGALLGAAVLAKGLVPLVLSVPLLWPMRRRRRELLVLAIAAGAVAIPWYALATARFGREFLVDFFWKHHFQRFGTDALAHVRPWWFYLPVIAGAVFPWTPGLFAIRPSPRNRMLLFWLALALIFFSASRNKLPGYILPLLPPLCILIGDGVARMKNPKWVLAGVAVLGSLLPLVAAVLPEALQHGLSRARFAPVWGMAAGAAVVLLAPVLLFREPRTATVAVAAVYCALVFAVKTTVAPVLAREISARRVWTETAPNCIPTGADRDLTYGLNYYAGRELPRCSLPDILDRE